MTLQHFSSSKFLVLIWTVLPMVGIANLIVVKTSANTAPVADYMYPIKKMDDKALLQAFIEDKPNWSLKIDVLKKGIQVSPSSMALGRVTPHYKNILATAPPFFIVGDDKMSKRWLTKNKIILKKIHAIGFVVDVSETKALALGQQIGLPLTAVSTEGILPLLKTSHYPVLVNEGWLQQ